MASRLHLHGPKGEWNAMMWMLLGIGSALASGGSSEVPRDSVANIEFTRQLPSGLRDRVLKARSEMHLRQDSLARMGLPERTLWLDSLRSAAKARRSQSLERLTPQERSRVEERLRELEHRNQTRKQGTSTPGYRQ